MPPRKRARVSQAASPTPASQPETPTPVEGSPTKVAEHNHNDPWTDKEEIGLFKGLIKWKPTGIHKHFRLLALHQYLLSNGYIHPQPEHTKPAGIWRKLSTLYDLEALDEREDARQLSDLPIESGDDEEEEEDDVYSEAENKIHREEFTLPDDEFAELKWHQRFASEKEQRDESPAALPELNLASEPPVRFTPSFSVEPSEIATPSGRAARGRSARGRGRGAANASSVGTRRSARKAEPVAEEEEQAQDEGDDEEDDEGEESQEEDEKSEMSKESTPARSTRAGRGTRGRGGARGRGRGRGRGR